ncbi:Ig-like domain-containing protein [Rhodococcus koreensis]|uniref:Ig-like domain-containing protein n=1 Tax=Rhodococcus koreensis TaxID=99653 RepID=UPI0036DE13A7
MAGRTNPPKTTVLTGDTLDAPQSTSPGDAPADTYDKKERVSSAAPDKAAAAADGHQTVNAVEVVGTVPDNAPTGTRTETYIAPRPDGKSAWVSHNYDTGVTSATPITAIDVTPATSSVAVAGTRTLTVKDQAGHTLTQGVTFASSDPTKATVDTAGVVTAVTAGTATITAKFGDLSDTMTVTVTA